MHIAETTFLHPYFLTFYLLSQLRLLYFLKLRSYCFTTLLKNVLRLNTPSLQIVNTPSLQIVNVIFLANLCVSVHACVCSCVLNKEDSKLREKQKEKKQRMAVSDGQK